MKGRIFTALSLYLLFMMAAIAQPVLIKEIPVNSTKFFKVNNFVFFISGDSLLRTDGTSGGTIFLKSGFKSPAGFKAFNGNLYFLNDLNPVLYGIGYKEIWRSDGTAAGTFLLKKSTTYNIAMVGEAGSLLYFAASDASTGYELYKTNGTLAGTSLLKDINPGTANGFEGGALGAGNILFFGATEPTHGTELWKTDGTSGGTVLVKDINPGVADGYIIPRGNLVQNQILYFTGNNGVSGSEPWKSDGTSAGTSLIKDIIPGASSPTNIVYHISNNGFVYFSIRPFPAADDFKAGIEELWKTNGIASSTTKVKTFGDSSGTSASLYDFHIYKGKIAFIVNELELYDNLWISDGTSQGTLELQQIAIDGFVPFFEVVGNYMFIYGNNQGAPGPFYRSDGTVAGTKIFTTFNAAAYLTDPRTVTKVGDLIFYGDHDGPSEEGNPVDPADTYQLIQTDGFTVTSLRKIFGGTFAGTDNIIDFNGKVLFTTEMGPIGGGDGKKRLWIYDPTKFTGPGLTLVNSSTDQDIRALKDNDTIIYNSSVDKITIKATPSKPVGSIVFKLDGKVARTETVGPYALQGDTNGDFNAWAATYGNHTLIATAYTGANGTGTVVEEKTIHFLIKQSGTTPPPVSIVFTLVNAATDSDIRSMKDNDTIVYNSATDKITVRANPSKTVGSVVFKLNGSVYRTETGVPYALQGDSNGDYNAWPATYGNQTLIATAFTGSDGTGSVVVERTIHFLVKQGGVTPPPTSNITFTLVNADTDQDVGPLVNGQTIDLSTIGTNALNIRANSNLAGTKSVVFDFNGKLKYKVESAEPFALFGDNNGNYNFFAFNAGAYTLKATPFTNTGGTGTAGTAISITFNVVGTASFASTVYTSPNPVSDKMKVAFSDETIETVYINIYDQTGREYYSGTHEKISGGFEVDLSNLNLQPGLYLVRIQNGGDKFRVVRIVKE